MYGISGNKVYEPLLRKFNEISGKQQHDKVEVCHSGNFDHLTPTLTYVAV